MTEVNELGCDTVFAEYELLTITLFEENVVTYISGSLVKRHIQTRSCVECFNLCITSTSLACHELVQLKEYKEGCMIKVSEVSPDYVAILKGISSTQQRMVYLNTNHEQY